MDAWSGQNSSHRPICPNALTARITTLAIQAGVIMLLLDP